MNTKYNIGDKIYIPFEIVGVSVETIDNCNPHYKFKPAVDKSVFEALVYGGPHIFLKEQQVDELRNGNYD